MALVIPPPTAIPNALNPTTAAVERDAEKREITPPVTADDGAASTADSTSDQHAINHKQPKDKNKKQHASAEERHATEIDDDDKIKILSDDIPVLHQAQPDVETIDLSNIDQPEVFIIRLIAKKQQILAKEVISDLERAQLSEINHAIKQTLSSLYRMKELDEVKRIASERNAPERVIKESSSAVSVPISLDDLFAFTSDDESNEQAISAKVKLARAIVGQFYEDNIEPQLTPKIDSKL